MAKLKEGIDEAEVARLAFEGASNRDIGVLLGLDHVTVKRRFAPILDKKRAERRQEIRSFQWTAAGAGCVPILIWLGKNELGQSDKATAQKTEITVKYEQRDIHGQSAGAPRESEDDP